MFLSGLGRDEESLSYLCLIPERELVLQPDTGVDDLKTFAFADDQTTFGYLSYHYGLPHRDVSTRHPSQFPAGHVKKYRCVLAYHNAGETLTIHCADQVLVRELRVILGRRPWRDDRAEKAAISVVESRQSLSDEAYIALVDEVLDFIRQGEVYQLNLSIKSSLQLTDVPGSRLALDMLKRYPAPYYTWFRTGEYRILSTSPERFLQVRDGIVVSEPVKGTLRFDNYSESLVEKLKSSPKEDAELSMIVDLIRNDISPNCEYGSVQVTDHKSVFAVDNLLQMYSRVSGQLRPEKDCLDLLVDAFPGGSVTGCPKKRAMQLIDLLEPHGRDVYCGSFFIVHGRRDMESSIAIRTGYFNRTDMTFNFFAGSGIVVSSEPEAEYRETMAKAEKFHSVFSKRDH
jgi:para-aminobenzoate synthetase component 1